MSDVEEPPMKMSKYTELQYLDEDCEEALDDGQEEWLSEGVLTDDDYNTTADTQNELNLNTSEIEKNNVKTENEMNLDTSQNEANDISQNETDIDTMQNTKEADIKTLGAMEAVQEPEAPASVKEEELKTETNNDHNIEETLNNLEGMKEVDELEDELDTFLLSKMKSENGDGVKTERDNAEDDDGNDTDDLLRMLGEDNTKLKKKTLKLVRYEGHDQSSDDNDEYIFERSKIKTLKIAKNALIKRQPASKAQPEDMSDCDDTDGSSDEGVTVKKMFGMARKHNVAAKSTAKMAEQRPTVKRVAHVNTSQHKTDTNDTKSFKQSSMKNFPLKSVLKSSTPLNSDAGSKPPTSKSVEIKTPTPFKPLEKASSKSGKSLKSDIQDTFNSMDMDDEMNNEYLDDEHYDEDEDEESAGARQRIRRPEVMDEEVPSDADTHTEDGSLYDELPSSDTDDMEDWFALDIRAECAGDYLPLLGSKAHSLLLAERARVRSRVATLRQSLSALTHSARRQAEQLRAAAMALAELDDTLRAA